jgi:hypothetical protein
MFALFVNLTVMLTWCILANLGTQDDILTRQGLDGKPQQLQAGNTRTTKAAITCRATPCAGAGANDACLAGHTAKHGVTVGHRVIAALHSSAVWMRAHAYNVRPGQ